MREASEVLEKFCPSMSLLYCDKSAYDFRQRVLQAMKAYAEFACEEQKIICALSAKIRTVGNLSDGASVLIDMNSIKTSPFPTLK